MSLRPKKGRVAVSILGVKGPLQDSVKPSPSPFYRVETFLCPPKNPFRICRGESSLALPHPPPLPFCSSPFPVIHDRSFRMRMLPWRDWSFITGRGRATMWENCGSEKFPPPPPPSRHGKTFRAFKDRKLCMPPPPFNMDKTSSYHIKIP